MLLFIFIGGNLASLASADGDADEDCQGATGNFDIAGQRPCQWSLSQYAACQWHTGMLSTLVNSLATVCLTKWHARIVGLSELLVIRKTSAMLGQL